MGALMKQDNNNMRAAAASTIRAARATSICALVLDRGWLPTWTGGSERPPESALNVSAVGVSAFGVSAVSRRQSALRTIEGRPGLDPWSIAERG